MARRRRERVEMGMPYLVAEIGGEIVGFAYAGPFHTRPAYGWTVENTVYVDPGAQRRGVATRLMKEIIERCTEKGYRQMIAVISESDDGASIKLHEKLGFALAGRNRAVGFKHGRWIDTLHLQLALGEGDATPPEKQPGT
jgi:phosphinothricin acetyltransferase